MQYPQATGDNQAATPPSDTSVPTYDANATSAEFIGVDAEGAESSPAPHVRATVTTRTGVCVALLSDASVRLTRIVHGHVMRDGAAASGWGQNGEAAGIVHADTRCVCV